MNRDLNLDSLKGLLILLVVVGHIPFGNFFIQRPDVYSKLVAWIYFFHMPLFFSLSVLFIKNNYKWLTKRAFIILAPYLFWFFFANKFLLVSNPLEFSERVLMGNWENLKSIIWFLPALFSLNLVFFIFNKYNITLKYTIFFLSILTLIFSNNIANIHSFIPFGLDVAFYIFTLAFIVKLIYSKKEKFIEIKKSTLCISILVSSTLLFKFESIKTHSEWHAIIDLAQFSVAGSFLGYISFLTLNISLFVLFLKLPSIKYLYILGKYSLPIFLLHLIILYKVPVRILTDHFEINSLIILISSFLISITLPIAISKSLMKINTKFKYIGMTK